MAASYLQTFPGQLDLLHEDEPADFLYVVLEGCVELYAHSNNRVSTMAMVHPVAALWR
jgi:CRP/FNR family transcriptional regulator, transcriptional activator FtrB